MGEDALVVMCCVQNLSKFVQHIDEREIKMVELVCFIVMRAIMMMFLCYYDLGWPDGTW